MVRVCLKSYHVISSCSGSVRQGNEGRPTPPPLTLWISPPFSATVYRFVTFCNLWRLLVRVRGQRSDLGGTPVVLVRDFGDDPKKNLVRPAPEASDVCSYVRSHGQYGISYNFGEPLSALMTSFGA
jgi:hypothetical protein